MINFGSKGVLVPSYKTVIIPAGLIILVLLLGYLVVDYSVGRINKQNEDINEAKMLENTLNEKLTELNSTKEQLPRHVEIASLSIPGKTPALAMMIVIKQLAEEKGVVIDELSLSGGSGADTKTASFTIGVSGDFTAVVGFTKEIKTFYPLSTIGDMEVNFAGESSTVDVRVVGYYADFPSTLPAIEAPIDKLTSDNYETLSKLSNLKKPPFTDLTPNLTDPRENPFSL
jgi:hypothetical protein